MAPSGPIATWSIQRRLRSVARTVVSPFACVATTFASSPPVTMRRLSQAAERIAPSCTRTRLCAQSGETSSRSSSPRTKAAASPRKCTPTTLAPALTGRVRSTTEAVSVRVSVTSRSCRRSGNAGRETGADCLLGHVAANKDHTALAGLTILPRTLMIAVEDHVHALKDEAVGIVLERENALGAQYFRPLVGDEVLDPAKELVGVERLLGPQRQRLHILVVIVLEPAVMVRVMIVLMIMV